MNACIISGKLTDAPQHVRLPDGTPQARFAITTGPPTREFQLKCVAYGHQTERLANLEEGNTVLLTGKLTGPGFLVALAVERL